MFYTKAQNTVCVMHNAFESYLIKAIRVFLHIMNWEESDDYDFDAELIDASENLPQRESVIEFLEIFRLEDDDLLPIEEVRKKWFVMQTKR